MLHNNHTTFRRWIGPCSQIRNIFYSLFIPFVFWRLSLIGFWVFLSHSLCYTRVWVFQEGIWLCFVGLREFAVEVSNLSWVELCVYVVNREIKIDLICHVHFAYEHAAPHLFSFGNFQMRYIWCWVSWLVPGYIYAHRPGTLNSIKIQIFSPYETGEWDKSSALDLSFFILPYLY